MAITRTGTVNQAPATGAAAMFIVKTQLKLAGWTVPQSSDGLTFNSTGDQITSGGAGAGGMANTKAWFLIRDPGSNRALTFQLITNTTWRVKIAESGTWTGGAILQTPTASGATDGVLYGAGTDAAPTGTTLFAADGTYRFHVVTDTVVVPGSNVYMFCFFSNLVGTATGSGLFMIDGLRAGTYDSADTAPWVALHTAGIALDGNTPFGGGAAHNAGFQAFFPGTAAIQTLTASAFGNSLVGFPAQSGQPNTMGLDPISGQDYLYDCVFGRTSGFTPHGIKGTAYFFKHTGSLARQYPTTINLATDPYIYFQQNTASSGSCFGLPWIAATVPSL